MNNLTRISALLLALALITSCQKNNLHVESSNPEDVSRSLSNNTCNNTEFRCVYGEPGNLQNEIVYKKSSDKNGRVIKIKAGVYSGGAIVTSNSYDIAWTKDDVTFLREGTKDTLLIVSLNADGQVMAARTGNMPDPHYLPTSFEYNGTRLSAMHIAFMGRPLTSLFSYTGNNVTKIEGVALDGEIPAKIEYQYGTGSVIKKQCYFDEPRKFSWNTFTLLQFVGLFPNLESDALRTRTIVYWENNYKAYDRQLVNHQVDGEGRLMQYAVSNPADGQISMRYFLDWSCGGTGNNN